MPPMLSRAGGRVGCVATRRLALSQNGYGRPSSSVVVLTKLRRMVTARCALQGAGTRCMRDSMHDSRGQQRETARKQLQGVSPGS